MYKKQCPAWAHHLRYQEALRAYECACHNAKDATAKLAASIVFDAAVSQSLSRMGEEIGAKQCLAST
jgi:hypothetical protein